MGARSASTGYFITMRDNTKFNIEEELRKLPALPGVYIMHGPQDEIIYVGKA